MSGGTKDRFELLRLTLTQYHETLKVLNEVRGVRRTLHEVLSDSSTLEADILNGNYTIIGKDLPPLDEELVVQIRHAIQGVLEDHSAMALHEHAFESLDKCIRQIEAYALSRNRPRSLLEDLMGPQEPRDLKRDKE